MSGDKAHADRSALLRMAGNVAAGLVNRHKTERAGDCSRTTPIVLVASDVARESVAIARAILSEVDGGDA